MANIIQVFAGIVIGIILYLSISGYLMFQRQKTVPLLERNCSLKNRCFKHSHSNIPKKIYRLVDFDSVPRSKAWEKTLASNTNQYKQYKIDVNYLVNDLKTNYKRWHAAYTKINPTYKQVKRDFIIYYNMFKYGGVYLDSNASAKSICKLIEPTDYLLLSMWHTPVSVGFLKNVPSTGDYQQWWFAISPQHIFLKVLLDSITYSIENINLSMFPVGREGGLHLTGSDIFTATLKRLVEQNGMSKYRFVCPNGNDIFKSEDHDYLVSWYSYKNKYTNTKEPIVIK